MGNVQNMKHVPFGVFHIFYISHVMGGNFTCTLRLFNALTARSKVLVKYLDPHCFCSLFMRGDVSSVSQKL